ncbi:MAG: cation diffusion facilitator family transporter [Pseudomonadales bacterium]|nr:cation diffusion facilitator family transporter [Pseudomonadales bacterium]
MIDSSNHREAVRVTLIGSALDLSLGILKILVGLSSGSFALVTDGIHSFSDLVTDAFVLLIARISSEKPDAEHPYGHARFETLGTIIIGIGLFCVAVLICYDSFARLEEPESLQAPGWIASGTAILSIIGKEWIYRYTRDVALKLKSSMLLANAWHSRTDAISSIVVLIGISGAQFGYLWMDLLAAIGVAAIIARIAWSLVFGSVRELVDTALPDADIKAMRSHILAVPGVMGVHELRSRQHGGSTLLDVHVQVNNKISVSEGHHLGDHLAISLKQHFPEVSDVVIHIDPELDMEDSNDRLPLRHEVIACLLQCWQDDLSAQAIEGFNLHYLQGNIQVDVYLNKNNINNDLINKLKQSAEVFPWLEGIRFFGRF